MPKLPIFSGSDVVKAQIKIGFIHIRTSGSHVILKKEDAQGTKTIPIPLHPELAKGTLLSIIHKSGLTREDFIQLFN